MGRKRDSLGKFIPNINTFVVVNDKLYCLLDGDLLFFTDCFLFDLVTSHVWGKCANGYSVTYDNGVGILAHRLLLNPKADELVDHINGNKKDNRLSNLRVCNKSQNAYNSKIRSNNKSGYTGVYYRHDTNKWVAEIKHLNKKIYLGCFANLEDAISSRKEAEYKYMKEFRREYQ